MLSPNSSEDLSWSF